MENTSRQIGYIWTVFVNYQLNLKSFHFQTTLYNSHKISDEYLTKLRNLMDEFMEVLQGENHRLRYPEKGMTLNLYNVITGEDLRMHTHKFLEFLETLYRHPLVMDKLYLTQLLDQIVALLHRMLYLLSFN